MVECSQMENFWSRVDKTRDCWLWGGAKRGNGYGCCKFKGKLVSTHRLAFELTYGPIPTGKLVCHRCDIRACVNPSHLFLGSHKDNALDALGKGRLYSLSNELPVIGEKVGTHKLTAQQVIKIRSLYESGLGYKKLAKQFGVDHKNIQFIIKRKTWRHI